MPRTGLRLLLGLLLCAAPVAAQRPAASASAGNLARMEVSLGYSYMRASTVASTNFDMHGGNLQVAVNLNDWFGIVGDFGGHYTSNANAGASLSLFSYMAGPRVSIHKAGPITPFVHLLVGAGHVGGSLYTTNFQGGAASRNAFAGILGGGLDLNLGRHVAIRAVQIDWMHSQFANGLHDRQNSLRLTTGLVFRFGGG